jgi:ABC-2 type transport system permease protein
VDRVADFRSDLSVALRIAGIRLRGQMQYRASFWMQIVGNFLVNSVEIAVTWSLFQHFDNLGGWSLEEIIMLHGLAMVMFALGDTVSNGIQTVPGMIREGTFDRTLLRPMSVYLQSLVNEVSLRHLGQLTQGLILLGVGLAIAPIEWSAGRIVYLPVIIVSGAIFFVALFAVEAILAFWTVNGIEAVNALTYGGSDLGQYPLHIFRRGMRFLFLWIVPIGFLTYYPALYLLDRDDPLGLPRLAAFASPLATLLFCLVVRLGWRAALRRYTSTGS